MMSNHEDDKQNPLNKALTVSQFTGEGASFGIGNFSGVAFHSNVPTEEIENLFRDLEEAYTQALSHVEKTDAEKAEEQRIENIILNTDIDLNDYDEWFKFCEKNTDQYAKYAIQYAIRWAKLMQAEMAQGKNLEDIAESTSDQADKMGAPVYGYVMTVKTLSTHWKYGERLRKWHNLNTQINNEGLIANATGAILNPALRS